EIDQTTQSMALRRPVHRRATIMNNSLPIESRVDAALFRLVEPDHKAKVEPSPAHFFASAIKLVATTVITTRDSEPPVVIPNGKYRIVRMTMPACLFPLRNHQPLRRLR